MDKILKDVIEQVKPRKHERTEIRKFADSVIAKLKKKGYKASLEGSLAKDTWISGSHDVDVFMFFDSSVDRKTLGKDGLRIGKEIVRELGGKPEIAYAEHPYVKTKIKNYNLDIVPCYLHKKLEGLKSAVDRTPFHTKYIKSNLSAEQKEQARILKQFMKGIHVYSAKESVRGFSGYLCELLVIKYKTFKNLIKAAKDWEYGLVIDLESAYKNKKESFKKFSHSLVFIDPIDKNRNVAAALENDNFEHFILAANEFLKGPSEKFFFPKAITPLPKPELEKALKKRGFIHIVKFKSPKLIEDTLHAQAKSSLKSLAKRMKSQGFIVMDSGLLVNKDTYFLLELENQELPEIQKMQGPPTDIDQKYQDKFLKKYKKYKPWTDAGRWYAEIPRRFTKADKLLANLLKKPRELGIGRFVSDSIKKEYILVKGTGIFKEYDGEFAQFLTSYLTKKKPWEW